MREGRDSTLCGDVEECLKNNARPDPLTLKGFYFIFVIIKKKIGACMYVQHKNRIMVTPKLCQHLSSSCRHATQFYWYTP